LVFQKAAIGSHPADAVSGCQMSQEMLLRSAPRTPLGKLIVLPQTLLLDLRGCVAVGKERMRENGREREGRKWDNGGEEKLENGEGKERELGPTLTKF